MNYYEPQQNIPVAQGSSRVYYWVTGVTPEGRTLLIGFFNSEGEAQSRGYETFEGEYEVHALPTTDRTKVVQMLKYRKMESGVNADSAMQRFRHG